MKQALKNIEQEKPMLNEIIYYQGNLHLSKGRYMGESFVELDNGEIDQFDEWKPVEPVFKNIAFRHVEDDRIEVIARGLVSGDKFNGEYRYNGMTYGVTQTLKPSIN